jgi:hypothetical protein
MTWIRSRCAKHSASTVGDKVRFISNRWTGVTFFVSVVKVRGWIQGQKEQYPAARQPPLLSMTRLGLLRRLIIVILRCCFSWKGYHFEHCDKMIINGEQARISNEAVVSISKYYYLLSAETRIDRKAAFFQAELRNAYVTHLSPPFGLRV